MYYIHWKTEQHTSCLLWWFFLASFNCSAPQCFVLIGSIYVTIFRGGLVGRQPASQAGWLEEIPRIPNTAHHWETLHSGKTLKNSALWNTAYCALQFTGLWDLLNHCIEWVLHGDISNTTFCRIERLTLDAWRISKRLMAQYCSLKQSEAVWSSLYL